MEPYKLPPGWKWVTLGEVALEIRSGFAHRKKGTTGGDLLHLRPYNIADDGSLNLSQKFFVPSAEVPRGDWNLYPGDVIFNNTNSVELVGKTALVTEKIRAAFSNHLTLVRPNPALCEGSWLVLSLRILWQAGFFAARCNKWIGQAGYNTRALWETPLPLPPLPEQRRIISYLNAIQEKATALKKAQESVEEDLKRLEQSILDRAFRGEL